MKKPSGSASRAAWMDYAIHEGHPREDMLELTRNGIRDLVKGSPTQEAGHPEPVEDEAVAPVQDLEQEQDLEPELEDAPAPVEDSTGGPDYSQFLTPADAGGTPGGGATAGQEADGQTGQQSTPTPVPTGRTVRVGGGESRAVSVLGTYQVTDQEGTRYTVSAGEVLEGPEQAVARGVELGLLQRL